MSLEVLIIGIGSGAPDQLTGEAIAAMSRVDVFLVADKGGAERDLADRRRDLCHAVLTHEPRIVEVTDPPRDRGSAAYENAVRDWHAARAERYAAVIDREIGARGTVGFLVWGDPAFYDSTIRIVEALASTRPLTMTVIPGISSLQLLAARHRIILNRIGRPVHLTTGRRLVEEYRPELGDVVVWLDGDLACAGLVDEHPGLSIYWGAQLGLPDETLLSGPLSDVLPRIRVARNDLRATRGWVMDLYLLRPDHTDG